VPGKILGLGECRSTVSVHIPLLSSELPAAYLLHLSTDGRKEWQKKGITKKNKEEGKKTLTVCTEYYPQMGL